MSPQVARAFALFFAALALIMAALAVVLALIAKGVIQ